MKSEIVAPHNSVTGIVNDSEYTKGDKISFTAIGDGMNVTSPQTNTVRWLPVKWQGLTERQDLILVKLILPHCLLAAIL